MRSDNGYRISFRRRKVRSDNDIGYRFDVGKTISKIVQDRFEIVFKTISKIVQDRFEIVSKRYRRSSRIRYRFDIVRYRFRYTKKTGWFPGFFRDPPTSEKCKDILGERAHLSITMKAKVQGFFSCTTDRGFRQSFSDKLVSSVVGKRQLAN